MPTEDRHPSASVKIASFSSLSGLGELPFPKTNIWNQVVDEETGSLGGYSNEAGVNSQVERVIIDILESLGVRKNVTIRAEVEVMRNRPDFMLILVNGHPIGTIESKQPGEVAMHHPNILGEVYDHLMHLHSIFRVKTPFAILTCYEEWRVCWLDHEDSNNLAAMGTLPPSVPYQTPMKRKAELEGTTELEGTYRNVALEDKPPSPDPPPTPSRQLSVGSLQRVVPEDAEGDVVGELPEAESREFCGTSVVQFNDRSLPVMLASVVRKMMTARQLAEPAVLRVANENTSAWKKAPPQDSLNFDVCISRSVTNFWLWEDLGHGADGRAFLVSGGTKGAVGGLKFFSMNCQTRAMHEVKMWMLVYSHLSPVKKTVRTVQVMGQTALLMPWFQIPQRTKSTLDAVERTLRKDFVERGIYHGDVAWRNVGVYNHNGETKAVVFDMQRVHQVQRRDDWVQAAVNSLSTKLSE